MFVYETKKDITVGTETKKTEALAIAFDSMKPVTNPDVIVWQDGTKVYAQIGETVIEGTKQA